jgi:aspartyl-tRNA(Asn)/glutamyl-tRNA(Gln) amidotransferase subunit B
MPDGDWRERYEAVIGLEVHVQLRTRTKMFCGCEPSFGEEPNLHTCPICLAHPGTLPVANEQAVLYGLAIALALECELASRSIFHRKNYFYPDIPKGYQISQYDIPLASAGRLGDVRIHRVHLEEDTGKMIHLGESGRIHASTHSLVDFNRGGTPLVEIVTEPDLRDAATAREWAQLLRETVRHTGASDVNMEEGSLRCDANVSLRPTGASELGTKTELKNMNSFRFLERGIEAELERQAAILDSGGAVDQETLHFDPTDGSLTPLRSKEYAHDYRYLPEPDLVPLAPTEAMIAAARESLGELPADRERRYLELGLAEAPARQLAFDEELGGQFDDVMAAAGDLDARVVANWIVDDLTAVKRQNPTAANPVTADQLVVLLRLVAAKEVTHQAGKEVLAALIASGGDPAEIVGRLGLGKLEDASELDAIVERAIEANPDVAAKLRAGKDGAIGPIVGAVMREAKGRADGGEVTALIRAKLGL